MSYRKRDWRWQYITKVRYEQLRNQEGLTDDDIIKKYPWLTKERLENIKKSWGES